MTMTLRRMLVRLLDRPGGRWLLATLATRQAGGDVRVRFDRNWIRILPDGFALVDQERFPYYVDVLARTISDHRLVEDAARD